MTHDKVEIKMTRNDSSRQRQEGPSGQRVSHLCAFCVFSLAGAAVWMRIIQKPCDHQAGPSCICLAVLVLCTTKQGVAQTSCSRAHAQCPLHCRTKLEKVEHHLAVLNSGMVPEASIMDRTQSNFLLVPYYIKTQD